MKLATHDLEKARSITEWLMINVSKPFKSVTGTSVRSEGWSMHVNIDYSKRLEAQAVFEIDETIVDGHTVTIFLLKWS
jgi:hypothetical protein